MLLSETYKSRLRELAGIKAEKPVLLLKEVEDLYANSSKRIKFDMNVMKQAIEGGLQIGMVFQSNNDKYKMPIWKMRIVNPVAMGYDKSGDLVVRGIHVEGQSEKKAIETGIRSAQAKNEWRLFKEKNIKSMFLTGEHFNALSLPGYNPNDSAMSRVIAKFEPAKAMRYQKKLQTIEKQIGQQTAPVPAAKPVVQKPIAKPAPQTSKAKDDANKLKQKIDKLNKLI